MALSLRLDLTKLGDKLPDGVRRAMKRGGNAAKGPIVVADAIAYPDQFIDPIAEKVANPIASARLKRCTIATRAHILGIADLPALGYENSTHMSVTSFRVRVERPDGDAETCVRQHLPRELRRLAPGSSVRALAHESDPGVAVLDWKTTGERMGTPLTFPTTLDQYAWPPAHEWPAHDAIEVHDGGRHTRRLAVRRETWQAVTASLVVADPTGGWLDDRQQVKLTLDFPNGARRTIKERVPDLALAKLVGHREGATSLGGMVTRIETVTNVGAPIATLVGPKGEVAVDWQATLNQPQFRQAD